MNWKAEFSKAGELALTSGTMLLLGWGLFLTGQGFWGAAMAHGLFGLGNLVVWGMVEMLLTMLFLGYLGNKNCAVTAAFMLNVACSVFLGATWGDWLMTSKYLPSEAAGETFVALLIWILGFLLLWRRLDRKILFSFAYVLVCVPVTLLFLMTSMVTD